MSAAKRLSITLAHSPDPDDAFMWWPLVGLNGAGPAIDTGRFDFELVTDDIESLNHQAESGRWDVTAISIAQYPQVRQTYVLTGCGASVGDGYGPKLVTRPGMSLEQLRRSDPVIAVPGERTTALAVSRLLLGSSMRWKAVPFDRIEAAVLDGEFDAGVVIHEGQLTCERIGLEILVDLGAWWRETRGLLLPLGGNAAKRDLEQRGGPGTLAALAGVLAQSLQHALEERETSLTWAMEFGRGIARADADQFVQMYVNKWTLDFGPDGEQAVVAMLGEAHAAGIVANPGIVDFVRPEPASATGVDA
ncbi:MAG: ABC transporter substrate-binding protein [Phycisphaerales bacterium]|nr:ABC transporter substrate-binding protein [Phycisphaerales bacterium]